jgi:formate dehydrogenase maturation protein FdhE
MISVENHKLNEGGYCPRCGDNNIDGESLDIEGGVITQYVSCNECYLEWTDVFTLQNYYVREI